MKKKRKMFAGLKIMSTFATQMRNKLTQSKCPDGGIGRRAGLKHLWETVPVRLRLRVQNRFERSGFFVFTLFL